MPDSGHPSNLLLKDYALGRIINERARATVEIHLPCEQCDSVIAEARRVEDAEHHKPGIFGRLFGRGKA